MAEPFYHVFRLPAAFPSEYCFGAGIPVAFQMVDWFGAPEGTTRIEISAFIRKKRYAQGAMRLLVVERGSSEPWIIEIDEAESRTVTAIPGEAVRAAVEAIEREYRRPIPIGSWTSRSEMYRMARAALAAALPHLQQEDGWRDIASAPENRPVLLRWTYWSALPINGILKHGKWEAAEALTDEGPGPTHWFPHPTLPPDGREG